MTSNKPLVSVIIPMYNVEAVLDACLDNLLQQTYRPLEVLMLDDASTDHTAECIEEATPRLEAAGLLVKVYHAPQNGGVAVMRNKGLDLAEGEYIYSYDADDYMEAKLIERLVAKAEEEGADMVTCDWFLRYEGNDRRMQQPKVETGIELFEQLCYGTMKWNVWLFLVRRSLFEGDAPLRYTPKDNMGEDMMMTSMLSLRAGRVATVSEAMYYYVKTNSGAQTANYQEAHWAQVARNLSSLEQYIQAYYPAQASLLNFLKLNLKLPLLISSNPKDYERWQAWYPEANAYVMQNPYLPMRTKLIQKAASLNLWWCVSIYNKLVMQWLYALLYK